MRRLCVAVVPALLCAVLAVFTVAAPAFATGAISGTVTDVDTGEPISPAFVYTAVLHPAGWDQADSGTTMADGTYTIQGLAPGTYHVEFMAFGYGTVIFNGRTLGADADPVVVTDGQATSGVDAKMKLAPVHLAGHVTDFDGSPVGGITVRLYDATTHAVMDTQTTDATGAYAFTVLRGNLHLYANIGFSDGPGPYEDQYYSNTSSIETASDIALSPGSNSQWCDAQLSMDARGDIKGWTRDAQGSPVPGIEVEAIRTSKGTVTATTVSDASGAYDLSGLPVASHTSYKIRFTDPDGEYLTEYYHRRTTLESATVVPVAPGATVAVDSELRHKPAPPAITAIAGLVSTTQPDSSQWYSRKDATFSWAPVAGVQYFRFMLDTDETAPSVLVPPGTNYSTTLQAQKLVAQSDLPTGAWPESSVAADVDGDGRQDVIVASSSDGTVRVFRGKGDGELGSGTDFAVGGHARSPVAADMNGDGHVDLVVATGVPDLYEGAAGRVAVLLGNGDGTFQAPVLYAVPYAYQLVVADFDRNGTSDVAASEIGAGSVAVLLGHSDGTLAPAVEYAVGKRPVALLATDLDGDGVPDLAVANADDSTLGILLGKGDGTFSAETVRDVPENPCGVVGGDFDGDGVTDLAVANDSYPSMVSVLLGTGHGDVSAPVNTEGPPNMVALTGGRFADGSWFLAASCPNQQKVQVFSDFGKDGFAATEGQVAGLGPWGVSVAKLDTGDDPDLVVTNVTSQSASVLLGTTGHGFRRISRWSTLADPVAIAMADLDGDGNADMATAHRDASAVSILWGDGAGGVLARRTDVATGAGPVDVAAADLNGDGSKDLVTADHEADRVSVLLSAGHGDFAPAAGCAVGAGPSSVTVADMNADGVPDLLTTNQSAGTVSFLAGRGDGTFKAAVSSPAGDGPVALAVADMDADQVPDIVTVNQGDSSAAVSLGDGTGRFAACPGVLAGWDAESVAVCDVDRDGVPDVVVTSPSQSAIVALLGSGDGTLRDRLVYPCGAEPASLVLSDMNGDGLVDAVVANRSDRSVSVLLARPDGGFTWADGVSVTGWAPVAVAIGDVDHDGRTDVAVAQGAYGATCPSSDSVAVLRNTLVTPSVTCPDVGDGLWYFHIQAVAPGDFVGPVSTFAIRIDTTPPVTDATVPDGWANGAESVDLVAADLPEAAATVARRVGAATASQAGAIATSGVASSQFSLDGGATWAKGTRVAVASLAKARGDGVFDLPFRSIDRAGNVESTQTVRVRVDTHAPTSRLKSASASGGRASVSCQAMDAEPCAGTASLQFVVKNGAGRVVLRRSGGSVKTGVWIRARFACHLKKGAYRCFVTAQDAAGNVQVKAVSARLTVR